MVAAGVFVASANVAAAAPAKGRVAVRVVPPFPLSRYAAAGAVGTMVPASGSKVSRESALASLLRGKLENSLLGGRPSGKRLITVGGPPAPVTIYVSLPPSGPHHNLRRYPIAVVGGGYHGILLSSATRIPGIVSIADVAPSVLALEHGEAPILTSRAAADAPRQVASTNARLDAAHHSRKKTNRVLIALVFAFAALAFALRSRYCARAALLAVPCTVLASALAAAFHVQHDIRWWTGAIALASIVPLAALRGRLGALAVAAPLLAYAVFLGAARDTVSLAAIGPHPEGGGRFYGLTNQVETLLLAPALALGALLPLAALALVALGALVVVGWSRLGADGGGLIVFAAGFAALALLRVCARVTPLRVAAAAAGVIALGLVLVGLDALSGGSSHVTHAVGGGPGSLLSDLGHRLHLSWRGIVAKRDHLEIALVSLAALVALAFPRPRSRTLDALLVALAVSLLVNDSGFDVLRFGALAAIAIFVWAAVEGSVRSRAYAPPVPRALRRDPAAGRVWRPGHRRPDRAGS
jgi:hypothetical protein